MTDEELTARLEEMAEPEYRAFSSRLTPTAYPMLGVRIPALRALAKSIAYGTEIVPDSYEKVMLIGFVTAGRKAPIGAYLDGVEAFLPLIDNWAVCDCFTASLKPVKKHPDTVFARFIGLSGGGVWERRFLAVLLMNYFLTGDYFEKTLDVYRDMKQGEYYVDMAIAWGLSVALVRDYDAVAARFERREYSPSVTDKAVRKARDSYRLTKARKDDVRRFSSSSEKKATIRTGLSADKNAEKRS